MKLMITAVAMSVHRPGINPNIGDNAIKIELADEGAGAFFRITSSERFNDGALRVDYAELGALLEAAKRLIHHSSD